ncbi:MAG TPA: single-stranded-DNA-specific exonuclease RecJ, partial [bacterium]|nr:single-stranded-DNA-specific exonuclease RecJ [bacterium]
MRQAVPRHQWQLPDIDPARVEALGAAMGVSRPLAALLLARGHDSGAKVKAFLRPGFTFRPDGRDFKNGEASVARIVRALRDGEPILIHGDYDVDGTCGAVIFHRALTALGGRTRIFLPNRFKDGYGVAPKAIGWGIREGYKLLITSDTGSQAHEAIQRALDGGLDVVVTDHHQLGERPLATPYFINPQQEDCGYPYKGLSGGGIALKVCLAVAEELGQEIAYDELVPLATLSTIADVCPLTEENRGLVREGLTLFPKVRQPGLRELVHKVLVEHGKLTTRDLSHGLIPKLNAIGRLGHPQLAVDLLLCSELAKARALARQLEDRNAERKAIQESVAAQAFKQAEQMLATERDLCCLVLASPHWHFGVLGIVAAKVVDKFGVSSILLSQHQEQARKGPDGAPYHYTGSGRAPAGVPLLTALESCRDLLVHFGGHHQALGLAIEAQQLDAFRQRLAETLRTLEVARPVLEIDAHLAPAELDLRLMKELEQLEPCGAGNPQPVFAVGPLYVASSKTVGDGTHRQLVLQDGEGREIRGIHFS